MKRAPNQLAVSSIVSPSSHWFYGTFGRIFISIADRGHPSDEVDPYKKPTELLELSPKGLVPALRLDNFTPPRALNESTVIMDFLEEYVLRNPARARLPSAHTPPLTLPPPHSSHRLATSDSRRSSHTTESLFPPLSDPCAFLPLPAPRYLPGPFAH